MQKKKLKLLLAGFAASTILFAAPLPAAASNTTPGTSNTTPSGGTSGGNETAPSTAIAKDLSTLKEALTLPDSDAPCPANCTHVFTASTGTAAHTVKVYSGSHTIYLRGNINIGATDAPAFEISGTANVTLALENGSNVVFDGKTTSYAGLQVSDKGQLTIRGNGELKAVGGSQGGAGIGGNSQSANVGSITILGGKVTAEGHCGGAGIGSGVGGAAATAINIKGGEVTAIGSDGEERNSGGDPVPPGPGIGSHMMGANLDQNYPGKASGNVTISGGTVYAYGGVYKGQYAGRYASGIQAQKLSSDKGSTVIYTNDDELPGVDNATELNAIIWEKAKDDTNPPKEGTVWGDATLNTGLTGQKLVLMTGSSLTIGTKIGFDINSEIKGDMSNRIIDVDNLQGPGQVNVPNKIVTLNESDFTEYAPFNDNKEKTFSGMDKDFTKDILVHRQKRENASYGPLPVDDSKFNEPVIELSKAGIGKICKAGWYTVTYQHKEDPDRKIVLNGIHVAQRHLNDCEIVIPDQIYTGTAVEPEISILLDKEPLEMEDGDYSLSDWENNIDVGDVSVGITANPQGNLDSSDSSGRKIVKDYKIIGVPIDDAVVTVDPASGIYSGEEHVLGKDFKISVSLNGAELKVKDDYEIVSGEGADVTSAGDVIYTIQGVNNYSGTKEAKYTIDRKEITIKPDSIIVESKDYDGNGEVVVKDVEFDGLVSADKGKKVKLKSKGIVDANNEGHAGEYASIHFEGEIELEYEDADGKRTPCTNYTVTYNGEEIPLKEKAVINKVTPGKRKPTHVDPYTVNANGITFDCTIQINRQPGIEYEFKMDGDPTEEDGWIPEINVEDKEKASAIFVGIKPAENADDKHIFFVRSKKSPDVVRVLMDTEEVVFERLPNPKELPAKPTISYNEEMNPDKKTYTVTIDKLEDKSIEYRIIESGSEEDVKFSDSNIDPLCNPGTTYIGQIRYKQTEVYRASDPVSSDELTTPSIEAKVNYKPKWTRIIPNQSEDIVLPPGLQEADYEKMSEVTADLTGYLSGIKDLWAVQGYDKERTAFYDVKIQVITEEGNKKTVRDAEPGDFENGGIKVTLPARQLPEGVVSTENQFSAVHMFETDDYAEYSAGDIEVCVNEDGAEVFEGQVKGVTFIVNGASPVGIAWSMAPEEDNTPIPDPTPTPTPPGNEGEDQTKEPLSDADDKNQDKDNNNQTDDKKNDGTDSQDKDAQSIADALKSAIASLAPKTGDTSKIIMWAVIAVAACIAVIAAVRSKMKTGRKGKSNAQTTASAKKPAASASKKTTTAGNKSAAAGAQKKTSAAAKKPASGTAKKTSKKK